MAADDINEKLLSKVHVQEGIDNELKIKDKILNEWKKMWVIAAPAIFTRFSTFGVNVISQAFIGHIGSIELAAFALVITVLLRFGNGILLLHSVHIIQSFKVLAHCFKIAFDSQLDSSVNGQKNTLNYHFFASSTPQLQLFHFPT